MSFKKIIQRGSVNLYLETNPTFSTITTGDCTMFTVEYVNATGNEFEVIKSFKTKQDARNFVASILSNSQYEVSVYEKGKLWLITNIPTLTSGVLKLSRVVC